MSSILSIAASMSFSSKSRPSSCPTLTASCCRILKMAFVGCVMKTRPLKLVFSVRYGTAPQWSMWKCVTSSKSIVDRSTSSKNGSDASPEYAGCTPQSNMIVEPR